MAPGWILCGSCRGGRPGRRRPAGTGPWHAVAGGRPSRLPPPQVPPWPPHQSGHVIIGASSKARAAGRRLSAADIAAGIRVTVLGNRVGFRRRTSSPTGERPAAVADRTGRRRPALVPTRPRGAADSESSARAGEQICTGRCPTCREARPAGCCAGRTRLGTGAAIALAQASLAQTALRLFKLQPGTRSPAAELPGPSRARRRRHRPARARRRDRRDGSATM